MNPPTNIGGGRLRASQAKRSGFDNELINLFFGPDIYDFTSLLRQHINESHYEISKLIIQQMTMMMRPFAEANEKNSTNMTRQIDRLCGVLAERIMGAQPYGYSWLIGQMPGIGLNNHPYNG